MPTTNKIFFPNGQSLDLSTSPYAPGTQEYYDWIRDKRNQITGRTRSELPGLTHAKHVVELDKLNPDISVADRNKHLIELQQQLQLDYDDQFETNKQQSDAERQGDQHGKVGAYEELVDPATGRKYYRATDNPYGGAGKVGGAGNTAPGQSADNSWNLADGVDVRTNEQKFYDRNLSGYNEIADENGKYSWYGTETGYDPAHPDAKRNVNLDALTAPNTAAPDARYDDYRKWTAPAVTESINTKDYWKYNAGPDKNWFDDQIRTRANKSPYARGGMGAYN